MKALVTGASGFTGSYMVRNLLDHGYQVRVLVRRTANLDSLRLLPVEIAFGDLRRPEEVAEAVRGVDMVFHIAALYRAANLPDSEYYAVNVQGTKNVLDAALSCGVKRVLHCSTCGIYGHVKQPPADESTPADPQDVYQETKWQAEQLAMEYYRRDALPVTIVRPVGIYGPGDTRMLKMYRSVQQGRFILFGGGNVKYHLTFVTDTVEGFRLAAEAPQGVGQAYNIAGEEYTTLRGFAEMIAAELGVKPPRLRLPVWPLEAAAVVCETICVPLRIQPPIFRRRVHIFTHDRAFSIEKAKRELGFKPQVGMAEGIHRTAVWYIQQGYLKERTS
ncbi:MAG: NAD-dependent epimerase/dehydratase family protein [candidate division KSB1 bacterium]|nr:NAD-dependent epimerase/dehydratase family protein [candidate division KSB1 bacterium]